MWKELWCFLSCLWSTENCRWMRNNLFSRISRNSKGTETPAAKHLCFPCNVHDVTWNMVLLGSRLCSRSGLQMCHLKVEQSKDEANDVTFLIVADVRSQRWKLSIGHLRQGMFQNLISPVYVKWPTRIEIMQNKLEFPLWILTVYQGCNECRRVLNTTTDGFLN